MLAALNIFVPHCSDLLTDHLPHGDGLIAHGFITSLARRGHRLHVAAQRVELREALHPNITPLCNPSQAVAGYAVTPGVHVSRTPPAAPSAGISSL